MSPRLGTFAAGVVEAYAGVVRGLGVPLTGERQVEGDGAVVLVAEDGRRIRLGLRAPRQRAAFAADLRPWDRIVDVERLLADGAGRGSLARADVLARRCWTERWGQA